MEYMGTPSPNSQTRASTKLALFAVSLSWYCSMVRRPDVRVDEERLLNSNPGWPILFVRVFGYRTSHGFNGSLPARNSIPVRIGERARPAAPDHRMWRALPVREQAPRFRSMDDLLLQCMRGNGLDGSLDFRRQQGKPAHHSLCIATTTKAAKIKPVVIGVTRCVGFNDQLVAAAVAEHVTRSPSGAHRASSKSGRNLAHQCPSFATVRGFRQPIVQFGLHILARPPQFRTAGELG